VLWRMNGTIDSSSPASGRDRIRVRDGLSDATGSGRLAYPARPAAAGDRRSIPHARVTVAGKTPPRPDGAGTSTPICCTCAGPGPYDLSDARRQDGWRFLREVIMRLMCAAVVVAWLMAVGSGLRG